jgi:octaprenyl-diphosphate synthase
MKMYSQIITYLQNQKTFKNWARLQGFCTSIINEKPKHIQIPSLIADAYGVGQAQQITAGSCLALMYTAIIALDDLLDEDLRFVSEAQPASQLANMSAGLVGMSFQIAKELDQEDSIDASAILADLLVNVSFGQALDTTNPEDEDAYWQVVRLKSGAFFAGAFGLGGVAGGAPSEDVETLAQLGETYGIMLQIHDDLRDALEVPANPDWVNGRLTLPILFAHLVDHSERERFDKIRGLVDDPTLLREAQEILVRSGAFSYGLYQIQEYHQVALNQLDRLSLRDTSLIEKLFIELAKPVENLIESLLDNIH